MFRVLSLAIAGLVHWICFAANRTLISASPSLTSEGIRELRALCLVLSCRVFSPVLVRGLSFLRGNRPLNRYCVNDLSKKNQVKFG